MPETNLEFRRTHFAPARAHPRSRSRNQRSRPRALRLESRNGGGTPSGYRDDRCWIGAYGVPVFATSLADNATPPRQNHAVVPVWDDNDKTLPFSQVAAGGGEGVQRRWCVLA